MAALRRWDQAAQHTTGSERVAVYRGRNVVERCIAWLKESRRVFSRFDKLATSYLAFLNLAILQRLLKFDFSDKP